jgi:SAM-dependent methyltransferase
MPSLLIGVRRVLAGLIKTGWPLTSDRPKRGTPTAPALQNPLGWSVPASSAEERSFFLQADPAFPNLRGLLPPGAVVLDLGCGHGRNLDSLREQGLRPIGLDVNADLLVNARQRNHGQLLHADLFAIPLGPSSVDGVVAWQVLCQFPSAQAIAALGEIDRVLKPNGLLVLAGCYAGCGWGEPYTAGGRPLIGPQLPPNLVPFEARLLAEVSGFQPARWLCVARKSGG